MKDDLWGSRPKFLRKVQEAKISESWICLCLTRFDLGMVNGQFDFSFEWKIILYLLLNWTISLRKGWVFPKINFISLVWLSLYDPTGFISSTRRDAFISVFYWLVRCHEWSYLQWRGGNERASIVIFVAAMTCMSLVFILYSYSWFILQFGFHRLE